MPSVGGEQERNVRIVGAVAAALFLLFLCTGVALYQGWELPPLDLRASAATPDGYIAPPSNPAAPAGTVSRASLNRPASEPSGKRLYEVNCAMCHGGPGQKIGPVGERYDPHPPPLQDRVPGASDERLYASITEGIRSTPTAETARYLPQEWHAYRTTLTEPERRAIVTYLRQSFR